MYRRFTFLFLPILPILNVSAQFGPTLGETPRRDLQTWYNLSAGLQFNNGWGLSANYSMRYYRQAGSYRGSFFFLTGSRRLTKGVSVLANYRLGLPGNSSDVAHRVSLGVAFQHADEGWNFAFRPLFCTSGRLSLVTMPRLARVRPASG